MTQRRVIQALILALPIGLALMIIVTVSITHGRRLLGLDEPVRLARAANKPDSATVGSVLQKDVDEAALRRTVDVLAGTIGERNLSKPENLESAAYFIESSMGQNNMGYPVSRQDYEVDGKKVWNLEARLPGRLQPKEIVVVGAHYDSAPGTPGANDNASGVAVLLAAAQALAGEPLKRELRFVAFVNEEPPYFQTPQMGSVVYARSCKARGDNITAMLSLETLGCYLDAPGSQRYPEGLDTSHLPGTGNFLAIVANPPSQNLLDQARAGFARGADFPVVASVFPPETPGVGFSDHWAFWQEGYPALMLTDTAPYRYAHYHKPTDTPDKVDYTRLKQVAEGVVAMIRALATQ